MDNYKKKIEQYLIWKGVPIGTAKLLLIEYSCEIERWYYREETLNYVCSIIYLRHRSRQQEHNLSRRTI